MLVDVLRSPTLLFEAVKGAHLLTKRWATPTFFLIRDGNGHPIYGVRRAQHSLDSQSVQDSHSFVECS